jgi:hypothetical protein
MNLYKPTLYAAIITLTVFIKIRRIIWANTLLDAASYLLAEQ